MLEDDTSSQFAVFGSQLAAADLCRWTNGSDQSVKDFAQLGGSIQQLPVLLRRHVAEVLGNHELRFDFDQRASGSAKKIEKIVACEPCLPFRDIGRNRYGCSSSLAGQTEDLVARKRSS